MDPVTHTPQVYIASLSLHSSTCRSLKLLPPETHKVAHVLPGELICTGWLWCFWFSSFNFSLITCLIHLLNSPLQCRALAQPWLTVNVLVFLITGLNKTDSYDHMSVVSMKRESCVVEVWTVYIPRSASLAQQLRLGDWYLRSMVLSFSCKFSDVVCRRLAYVVPFDTVILLRYTTCTWNLECVLFQGRGLSSSYRKGCSSSMKLKALTKTLHIAELVLQYSRYQHCSTLQLCLGSSGMVGLYSAC